MLACTLFCREASAKAKMTVYKFLGNIMLTDQKKVHQHKIKGDARRGCLHGISVNAEEALILCILFRITALIGKGNYIMLCFVVRLI